MNTSELTGALLDYWVARAEGKKIRKFMNHANGTLDSVITDDKPFGNEAFSPSINWAQGGPIIERERLVIGPWRDKFAATTEAYPESASEVGAFGDSYLIAAMRAYVASKFGDEVPDEQ